MYGLFLFVIIVGAIWFGSHVAGIENVNVWDAVTIGFLGALAAFILGLVLFPLRWIPVLGVCISAGILICTTVVSAKVVLSCAWNQAWTIAGFATAASLLLHGLAR
jgi:hypothetical protein